MMSELPKYVLTLLGKIATAEGFSKYSIETGAGSKHGDGFMGLMVSATIVGEREHNGFKCDDRLHLLCKLTPSSAERRQTFMSEIVFEREVLAYNKILPLFAEFQREKGLTDDECFNAYPKCYAAIADAERNEYVLIMEDLRTRGFQMWPKSQPFAADHAYAVIGTMAKLHAISFALKDQRPEAYAQLRNIRDLFEKFLATENTRKMFCSSYDGAKAVLEDAEHIRIAEDLKINVLQHFDDCVRPGVADPYAVLLHGDCWINNMLFQYKDEKTKELTDMCFVDWQVIRVASPALDLHYNIFNSTDKEFRQAEYHNLMAHYHKQLSAMIRRLGSDPHTLYPWADFQRHLKQFGKFAFLMSPLLVPMICADAKDIPDMDEISAKLANNDDDVGLINQNCDAETQRKIAKRINDVFTDLVGLGYWN